MRIGVDVQSLHLDQRYQGVGYYTYQLLLALAALDHDNQYVLFGVAPPGGLESELASRFCHGAYQRVHRPRASARWADLWDMVLLPADTRRARLDLFFFPSLNRLGWGLGARSVIVIHDMIPLLEQDEWLQTGWKHRLLYAIARRADRIVAISENTRADVHRLLGIPLARICTTPAAADARFHPVAAPAREQALLAQYGIERPFVLYVGDLRNPQHNRRKNVEALLSALATLCGEGVEHAVVLAGKRGEHADHLARQAQQLGIGERVIFTDYVPDEALPDLFRAATVFAYPSRYEGFGLPLLQAMASGTPTLALRAASIPEVVGEAGDLADPDDPEDFVRRLRRLLTDPAHRAAQRQRGLARAETFSWERCAADTLRCFARAAGNDL